MSRSGITIKQKGDFDALKRYLERNAGFGSRLEHILRKYGEEGVRALREATPKKSGKTALKWRYRIEKGAKGARSLSFYNEDREDGVAVIVFLVYGHATRSGGWVEGRDFVTPAVDPIFADIQKQIRKEVTGT